MALYKRILVAVDLAPESALIAQRARELADTLQAQVEIIHVVEPVPPVAPMPLDAVAPVIVTTQTELIEIAQEHIERLGKEIGVPETQRSVVVGSVRSEIVRVATERGADLIVVGSRGRHPFAFLVKPAEDAVIHKAPCDVLAIHLPAE